MLALGKKGVPLPTDLVNPGPGSVGVWVKQDDANTGNPGAK